MKSQNVLKTTSQMRFSRRHLAATSVLSKFIKQPLQVQPTGLFVTAASLSHGRGCGLTIVLNCFGTSRAPL